MQVRLLNTVKENWLKSCTYGGECVFFEMLHVLDVDVEAIWEASTSVIF